MPACLCCAVLLLLTCLAHSSKPEHAALLAVLVLVLVHASACYALMLAMLAVCCAVHVQSRMQCLLCVSGSGSLACMLACFCLLSLLLLVHACGVLALAGTCMCMYRPARLVYVCTHCWCWPVHVLYRYCTCACSYSTQEKGKSKFFTNFSFFLACTWYRHLHVQIQVASSDTRQAMHVQQWQVRMCCATEPARQKPTQAKSTAQHTARTRKQARQRNVRAGGCKAAGLEQNVSRALHMLEPRCSAKHSDKAKCQGKVQGTMQSRARQSARQGTKQSARQSAWQVPGTVPVQLTSRHKLQFSIKKD